MLKRFLSRAGFSFALSQSAFAKTDPWQLNMPQGVSPLSHEMYNLHMIGLVICTLIGIVVFSVMIYSLIYHRKKKGYVAAAFHEHPLVEIIWSVIPFLILVALAIPATRTLIRLNNTDDAALTIKVVGSQWKWQYQYLDQGIRFYSNLSTPYNQIYGNRKKDQWYLLEVDKPLVLPVGQKIRFLVTSVDVVHSWWVPALGVKRDAIPGFMYESWTTIEKPGTYRGQCAELCGLNHGFMPIVVKAVTPEAFKNWVEAEPKVVDKYAKPVAVAIPKAIPFQVSMKQGKKLYEQNCAACHKADGTGLPPLYPGLKASSVSVGKPISRHIARVLNGVLGSAMQGYREVLSDEEIAEIVTYERNGFGNNTGDLVQPEEVAKVRNESNLMPVRVKTAKPGGIQQ